VTFSSLGNFPKLTHPAIPSLSFCNFVQKHDNTLICIISKVESNLLERFHTEQHQKFVAHFGSVILKEKKYGLRSAGIVEGTVVHSDWNNRPS
jgi:hypothetical protein